MALQDLLKNIKELDESVLVLELNNGFAIGCEKEFTNNSELKDVKFTALSNLFGISTIPHGDNAKYISNGDYASFLENTKQKFEEYASTLEDPLVSIKTQMGEVYHKILQPIDVQPVRKRNFKFALGNIGITAVYPLAVAGTFAYILLKEEQHGDEYLFYGVASAPSLFPTAIKELISPSVKGVRIANKEILSDKPKDENYIAIDDCGELNPDFFGGPDIRSVEEKGYLSIVFPDGLELLGNGCMYYPVDKNHYEEGEYFLPVDKTLKDKAYSLYKREEKICKNWRDFRDNLNFKEVAAILTSLNLTT